MAAGRFSDFRVETWLRELQTCWLALHYDNPDVAGAYASEVSGNAYHRCEVDFTDPSNRAMWNSSYISFTGLPAIVLTHMAAWDSPINGNLEMSAPLAEPIRVVNGGRYDLGLHQFAISFK